MPDNIIFAAPNMYVLRNWIATGLADKCKNILGLVPVFISSFKDEKFNSNDGSNYVNYCFPASMGKWQELPEGFSKCLFYLYYLRIRTFALEVENGSLQMMQFSRRRDVIHYLCSMIKYLFPRGSQRRIRIRSLIDSINPYHEKCAQLLEMVNPKCVVVGSPGFQFLDQLVIIESRRQHIPVHCVVNSWDNMTSRGPMIRRPDSLMVWNEYMKEQASVIHQYPGLNIKVVGTLQFSQYSHEITEEETNAMFSKLGLLNGSPYLLYLTGQHLPEYEAEDVDVLLRTLEHTKFSETPLVVRIHSQANNLPFKQLRHKNLLLDCPPKFIASGENGFRLDFKEIRMMAALLKNAAVVFASWGTTALLEAAIFDRPIIQLRWMKAFQRKYKEQAEKVMDYQKYLHLIPFDETRCRLFSDFPENLEKDINTLFNNNDAFQNNRKEAVLRLATPPLEDAPNRVIKIIADTLN